MTGVTSPLRAGEQGPYAQLAGRNVPEGLVVQFIPSLAAMLTRAEQLAGRPLTEEEVVRVRDHCPALVIDGDSVRSVEEVRGYADLDPGNVWEEWQALRAQAAPENGSD